MYENEKWYIKSWKGDAAALAERLGVSPLLAGLLIGRGVLDAKSAREFLAPDISMTHDALLMKDMDVALGILERAAADGKKVLVIGDYDVDGIMGLYILCSVLGKAFASVGHYIPHRVDDGYGINEKIVEDARRGGVGLIVTCDNGISAHESVRLAKSYGIDVVITDHHEPPSELLGVDAEGYGIPGADAVVDPKRQDCGYPFKGLCGAAVAYKLATAFSARTGLELTDTERRELFCFMAIATVCDIVELVDENRRIVYHGLKLLNEGIPNPGLAELVAACGLSGKALTSYGIGHILGPCINAAGRLDTAELSYRLLTEHRAPERAQLAARILELNRARQDITAAAIDEALALIESTGLSGDSIIVLYMPGTHESVSGIVAGRLKDRYARPVIVLTDSRSGCAKGSGRSIEGYDLLSGVVKVRELLLKYGGHSMAVGISVDREKIDAFREAINAKCEIGPERLVPKERIDLCVEAADVAPGLVCEIARLEPFGRGNARPLFALRGVALEQAALIGARRNVVRMKLRACGDRYLDAVFFGDAGVFTRVLGLTADEAGTLHIASQTPVRLSAAAPLPVDVIFHPEINEYNGNRKLQLTVRSIRKTVVSD